MLQSIRDWAVLAETGSTGVYQVASAQVTIRGDMALWMIEAVLLGSGITIGSLRQLERAPALFPFSVAVESAEIERRSRLELVRQAGDEDTVGLRYRAVVVPGSASNGSFDSSTK